MLLVSKIISKTAIVAQVSGPITTSNSRDHIGGGGLVFKGEPEVGVKRARNEPLQARLTQIFGEVTWMRPTALSPHRVVRTRSAREA